MVGYQRGANPELSLVNRYVDLPLTALVRNVSVTYVPELPVSETSACCSDHQSFLENGYASAGYVEAGGYTIDPQYHNTSTHAHSTRHHHVHYTLSVCLSVCRTAATAPLTCTDARAFYASGAMALPTRLAATDGAGRMQTTLCTALATR
jgi:hypothetical protein